MLTVLEDEVGAGAHCLLQKISPTGRGRGFWARGTDTNILMLMLLAGL